MLTRPKYIASSVSLAHHCYNWHPGSHCGWICNQLTSKVHGGITGSRLSTQVVNSHLVCDATIRQPGFDLPRQQWSLLKRTIFAWNRDTVVPGEGNGDLQTLICVLVARPRRCLTLSNPVSWQNWMAAYLGYTLQMKMLFCGWPVMVHDTQTRRRRLHCILLCMSYNSF